MQPSQQDRLKKLIASSKILTPHERQEWLDMLMIMNDKQVMELEGILGVSIRPPQPSPQISLPPVKPPSSGRLSHIANLPSAEASRRTTPDAQSSLTSNLAPQRFTRFVPPAPVRVSPRPDPPETFVSLTGPSTQQRLTPMRPKSSVTRSEESSHTNSISAAPTRRSLVKPQLETLADVAKLNMTALRAMSEEELLTRLQQLVGLEGYFNVLSYLEDSPLYRAYVETGHTMLTGQAAPVTNHALPMVMLSKEELETFVDILRKIQID